MLPNPIYCMLFFVAWHLLVFEILGKNLQFLTDWCRSPRKSKATRTLLFCCFFRNWFLFKQAHFQTITESHFCYSWFCFCVLLYVKIPQLCLWTNHFTFGSFLCKIFVFYCDDFFRKCQFRVTIETVQKAK